MTSAPESPLPPADGALVFARSRELRTLAARYGIRDIRYASPGRLVGHLSADCDALDVADFELAAETLLRRAVRLYSDSVLTKPNVSPDLVAARPL